MAQAATRPVRMRNLVTYRRCRIEIPDESGLSLLREMGADGRISADHFLVKDGMALMELNRRDVRVLTELGFVVEEGEDVTARAATVRTEVAAPAPAVTEAISTGFVTSYLDTSGIAARFQTLHADFPAITQWSNLPNLTSGYDGGAPGLAGASPVRLFRINTTPASVAKPGLLLIAGIHAREWVPPLAAIEFAEQLLRNYSPGSLDPAVQEINQLVEQLDIFIFPAANPDGINYSHHDSAMWRKNRRPNPPASPASCDGVDNNRNYGVYFAGGGSSGDPCSDSYRGSAAFSEPENRNVLHIVEQFPNILTAVDCHSFGEDIFRAHPSGGVFIGSEPVEPRDHQIFLSLEAAMNSAISSVSPGKTYSTGTTNNHAGTADDYLFLAHRIFGFTMECGQSFQPPIATALVTVQEVAAALRALARETVTLASQFTFPVRIAHVVDKSGSMIAYGFDAPAKANAKRMIDLMSLNDSAAVVAFNQTASVQHALSVLTNPGSYSPIRAAVDSIVFGGTTSIGAGLQAAATQLSASSTAGSIVLLSDGYQNQPPSVATVLPTLPPNIRVHTIALGPTSDQALLEMMANSTGGQYYFSPDAVGLHEIYNFVRADVTEEGLALNESIAAGPAESTRMIVVDEGAAHLCVSVSWSDPNVALDVELRPPSGPVMDLSRLRVTNGAAYRALRLRRPQAGPWTVAVRRRVRGTAVPCTVSAYLQSGIRLRLFQAKRLFLAGQPLQVFALIDDSGRGVDRVQARAVASVPKASVSDLLRDWTKPIPKLPKQLSDAARELPGDAQRALAIRYALSRAATGDPLAYQSLAMRRLAEIRNADSTFLEMEAPHESTELAAFQHLDTKVRGTYNVRIEVQGRTADGKPFVRVGLRSVRIQ